MGSPTFHSIAVIWGIFKYRFKVALGRIPGDGWSQDTIYTSLWSGWNGWLFLSSLIKNNQQKLERCQGFA
jgi:hypothetical protein